MRAELVRRHFTPDRMSQSPLVSLSFMSTLWYPPQYWFISVQPWREFPCVCGTIGNKHYYIKNQLKCFIILTKVYSAVAMLTMFSNWYIIYLFLYFWNKLKRALVCMKVIVWRCRQELHHVNATDFMTPARSLTASFSCLAAGHFFSPLFNSDYRVLFD